MSQPPQPLHFHKYEGAGNDFIIVDNREQNLHFSKEQIARLCHRRFGIGADGLMILETAVGADFTMIYYNADGGLSTLCGNGSRCIVAYAKLLRIIENECTFLAADGLHAAQLLGGNAVALAMNDVTNIRFSIGHAVLDTGSPHYVQWVADAAVTDVDGEGRAIRYSSEFIAEGINVNFAEALPGNGLKVRTYERGVEAETLSCGTGVTAVAIASACTATGSFSVPVETPGGTLHVSFKKTTADTATDIVLTGPAELVFTGTTLI